MFALHQPRPRCVASHASTHALKSGSPRSPGTAVPSRRPRGHVSAIVAAPSTASGHANGVEDPKDRAVRTEGTEDGSAHALNADVAADRELLDDHREDRDGRNSENRADEAPQRAADEQRN